MSDLSKINLEALTPAEFEQYLPELFATAPGGKVSQEPRLATFLQEHPDCAALVRDLETIAATARSLFEPSDEIEDEPSDHIWNEIQKNLGKDPIEH